MKRERILNLILSVFASLVLVISPAALAVTNTYAAPSLPSSPSTPDSPDSPDSPEQPSLPGEEEDEQYSNSGSNYEVSDETSGDSDWISSSNNNTGEDSTNTSNSAVNNNTDADINNDANIDTLATVDSTSGNNTADKNTGDGSVNSGEASIEGSVETSANEVNLGGLECSTECDIVDIDSLESLNSNTGSGSENESNSELNNTNDLEIDNDADFDSLLMFDANSGDNSASYNTGNGSIDTGDTDILLTAINAVNNINVGYDVFNVYDDQTGDLIINFNDMSSGSPYLLNGVSSSNNTTGTNSTNDASSTANNNNTILIDNYGNVVNNYYLDANSGNNTADKNTGNGTINTGDANAVFNLINFLNNVFLGGGGELLIGVANIFGTLNGDIILTGINNSGPSTSSGSILAGNSATGSGSSNEAESGVNNDTDIALANNADILNNVTLDANTGGNDATDNTGNGSITTGNSDANLNVTNIANNNSIGDGSDVWMVLINNLGSWTGKLIGATGTGGTYSPFFTFMINPDGTISAENQNTGSGSENNASSTIDNDTDIGITNTGNVVNNVIIDANTGDNSVSNNTGSGTITTGNANIAANIINMINNTFLGGRFLLTIVNVFGTFNGDIGPAGVGGLSVSPQESLAISQNKVTSSSNYVGNDWGVSQNNFSVLQATKEESSNSGEGDENIFLVAGRNLSDDFTPITRISADRGLFDGFRLEYLLIPVILGTFFSIFRRVVVRR